MSEGWLIATVVGVVVVAAVWAFLFVASRFIPAGRLHEIVAFAPNCAILLRRLRTDRRLPRRGRLALWGALAYIVSPVQLIPNVIPVIGQTDDFLVLAASLRYACRRLPVEDVRAAWPGDIVYLERLLGTARSGSEGPSVPVAVAALPE
jgi:uncharacterized membrane protein YkvA (DUF1232 family)